MANKRIELEQYKHYFDLLQEEPNRKTWRKGMKIAFVAASLLALVMFVLGMLSGSLATNARNVLEQPPAKQSPTQPGTVPGVTPGGTETPFSPTPQQGIPYAPSEEQQGVPVTPQGEQQSPGSKAPSAPLAARASYGIPFGAGGGALIAQAQPATPETPETQSKPDESPATPIDLEQSTPGETPGSTPGQQSGKKTSTKSKGPGEQTRGVGNLANLANGAGGRGFQLYLLVMFIGLLVILYLPVRKARLEGKSK